MPEPERLDSKGAVRRWTRAERAAGRTIGFVPTMGFLHEGHLSLVRRARAENDRVVLSIYVNPLQFGPGEDLDAYPRDLEGDLAGAGAAGADAVFTIDDDGMYPADFSTYVVPEGLVGGLCGARRPGHFRGVTTVVAKLFHLVAPDRAYFGQKDYQQAAILRRMVRDLDFDLEMIVCPIVREPDGLALSSRNAYLDPAGRRAALVLWRTLGRAADRIAAGERDPAALRVALAGDFDAAGVRLDYLEFVDPETLEPVEALDRPTLLAVAAFVGRTRLIDNAIVGQ